MISFLTSFFAVCGWDCCWDGGAWKSSEKRSLSDCGGAGFVSWTGCGVDSAADTAGTAGAGDERPAVVAESSLCGWGWRLVKGVGSRFSGRLVTLEGIVGAEDVVGLDVDAVPPSASVSSTDGSEGTTRSRTHDFASYLERINESILLQNVLR